MNIMAECAQPEEENAIAFLNVYAGKNGRPHPEYKEKEVRGEPHKRTFTLTCEFVDLEVCCEGKSKKDAKRACAASMVKKMREAGLLSSAESTEYEPVAVLQQLLQKKGYPLPRYEEVGTGGLPHCKTFSIKARALYPDDKEICKPAVVTASSKKEAKKKAASELLNRVRPLLDTSPVVKHSASYTSSSNIASRLNNSDSDNTQDRSFTLLQQTPPSMTSSPSTRHNESTNSLNTSMASLNISDESCDMTDNGLVELPKDIDVVFVDGDDKKLCLATVNHAGEKITGCGRGNSEETAKQSAIVNLTSNFRILCTPLKI